ncbi:MAG: VOC family protein [Mycobacteriales bacterium]
MIQTTGAVCRAHVTCDVRERHEVDILLTVAATDGAEVVKPAADTTWGGYSGYFTDPDGYLWEVAWGRSHSTKLGPSTSPDRIAVRPLDGWIHYGTQRD